MNSTKYVRSPRDRDNPFTRISNSIAKLPAVEAGIMLQILSNSDDWVINKEVIKKRSGLGRDGFKGAWNSLKSKGYISVNRIPTQNGKFQYEYIIYEDPENHNPPSLIEEPTTDIRSTETRTTITLPTVNHTTVTGGTNNYYINKEAQETISSSGSDGLPTKVEVRPGNNNNRPIMLGPEKEIEKDLQIVPPPSLCGGEGRDDDGAQYLEPEPRLSQPSGYSNFTTETPSSLETEGLDGPISGEVCFSKKNKISAGEKEIMDNLEIIPNDVLKDLIHIFYKEDLPNWEVLLRNQHLHFFLKDTAKFAKPDVITKELLTEYYNRLEKEKYRKS